MELVQITFAAALVLGFSYGAGPCNIACLPYLGPIFLSRESEQLGRWGTILAFSTGRISSYTLLGSVAGLVGEQVTNWLKGGSATLVLGGVTIAVGLLLLSRSRRKGLCCSAEPNIHGEKSQIVTLTTGKEQQRFRLGLFGIGFSMALNPCLPLGTIAIAAAATADPVNGLLLGLGFGLGAVAIPGLLFGWLLSRFGDEIRFHLSQWQGWLEQLAALLLIALGGATLMGWVSP